MNSYQDYNRFPYVNIGIDKITLGTDSKNLNYHRSPPNLEHIIDIVRWGNWSELNIQWEFKGNSNINKYFPWYSILLALQYSLNEGLFIKPIAEYLRNCITAIFCFNYPVIYFIEQCFYSRLLKLDEYEIFFDFYNYNPFISFDDNEFIHIFNSNTVYTQDSKKIMRTNGELKRKRRSLLCCYDRGKKINSPLDITRFEFRICDDRTKLILNPQDILLPLDVFIDIHCLQIKHILKRYIPKGSIQIDNEYIFQNAPVLFNLVNF